MSLQEIIERSVTSSVVDALRSVSMAPLRTMSLSVGDDESAAAPNATAGNSTSIPADVNSRTATVGEGHAERYSKTITNAWQWASTMMSHHTTHDASPSGDPTGMSPPPGSSTDSNATSTTGGDGWSTSGLPDSDLPSFLTGSSGLDPASGDPSLATNTMPSGSPLDSLPSGWTSAFTDFFTSDSPHVTPENTLIPSTASPPNATGFVPFGAPPDSQKSDGIGIGGIIGIVVAFILVALGSVVLMRWLTLRRPYRFAGSYGQAFSEGSKEALLYEELTVLDLTAVKEGEPESFDLSIL